MQIIINNRIDKNKQIKLKINKINQKEKLKQR